MPIIFAVSKGSQLSDADILEYLENKELVISALNSPKGFKVFLPVEKATELLEKGDDTLKNEKVNFAEDDPYCTIFVKGITDKVDDKDLNTALSSEGKICMIAIQKDATHKPIGTAFVRFNRKEDALKAAEKFANLTINEVDLEISKFVQQTKPKASITESATFRNVPSSYSQEDVERILSEYGQISDLSLDTSTGTGSVSYSNHGSVTKAIMGLNGKKMEDQTFFITENTEKKKKTTQYNNLYVGNVDPSVTEDELKKVFGEFGEIESLLRPTRKVTDENGTTKQVNKNHVFVSFKDSKDASNVIKEMDGRTYWNRILDINYYDPQAKFGPNAKSKNQDPNDMQNLANNFMSMMQLMASEMANSMRGGRGGYSGGNQGYRGGSNYNRGGRGSRGGPPRGSRGSRGGRGGYPGGSYPQVRSQYEQKPMMPHTMGPPMGGMPQPMGGHPPFGGMDPGMGGFSGGMPGASPPMPTGGAPMSNMPAGGMPPKMQEAPKPADSGEELGYSQQELEQMPKEERENILGTFLYNKLEPLRGGEVAGKITGMFLDLDVAEVYSIASDDNTFQGYVQEAMTLIEKEEPGE